MSSEPGGREPLFRYEYMRAVSPKLPAAHIQFHGRHPELERAMQDCGGSTPRAKRRKNGKKPILLSALHFPVGGTRFRPAPEDVLEMLIEEFGVRPEGSVGQARAAIAAGRERWRRMQVSTVVRDAPSAAARTLEELGYSVTPPEEGPKPDKINQLRMFEQRTSPTVRGQVDPHAYRCERGVRKVTRTAELSPVVDSGSAPSHFESDSFRGLGVPRIYSETQYQELPSCGDAPIPLFVTTSQDQAMAAPTDFARRNPDRLFAAYDLELESGIHFEHRSAWATLFRLAHQAGQIEPVGVAVSKRPSRTGGVARVWRAAHPLIGRPTAT